ncbi:MAG: hypothetical protein KDB14_06045 [Planctomycetales bacterium]|nr:hypothetical protein [Planctomycetales bacterium]
MIYLLLTLPCSVLWGMMLWGVVDPAQFIVFSGFGLFFVLVGCCYGSLAGMLNQVHIQVSSREVRVWQSPLPHWRCWHLPVDKAQYLRRLTVFRQGGYAFESLLIVSTDDKQRTIVDTNQAKTEHIDEIAVCLANRAGVPLVAADGEAPDAAAVFSRGKLPRGVRLGMSGAPRAFGVRWPSQQILVVYSSIVVYSFSVIFGCQALMLASDCSTVLPGLVMGCVSSIFTAAAVYWHAAQVFDWTWFSVSNEVLHVAHLPLARPGNRSISRSHVQRIATAHQARSREGERIARCFSVVCHRRDGREITLVSKLTSSQATFLAAQLNEQLAL